MLQKLRDQSGSWFVKILLGSVAVSMGAFGIVDVIRGIGKNKPAITVGDESISPYEISDEVKKFALNLQHSLKRPVGVKELEEYGVQKQVIDSLVNKYIMNQEIKRLELVASDTSVRDFVRHFPMFKDENGKFSLEKFHAVLRHNEMKLDEKTFLDQVRRTLQEQQLMIPLTYDTKLPKSYIDTLFQALFGVRKLAYITLPFNKIKVTDTPSENDLQSLYKQNKELFTRPETRDVEILYISPERLYSEIKIQETAIQEQYNQRKETDFTIPEKRNIKRYRFSDKSKAMDIHKRMKTKNPSDLKEIIKNAGGKITDFGNVTLKEAADSGAEIAFDIKKAGPTELIITDDYFDIYYVNDITPSKQETYQAVRPKIEKELKDKEASNIMFELRKKVEDAVSGGSKLEDAAKEFNLEVLKVNAINTQAKDLYGRDAFPKEISTKAAEESFKLSVDETGEFIEGENSGFIVYLKKINPSFVVDFNSVKSELKTLWSQEKQFEQAIEKAKKEVEHIKNIEDLETLSNREKAPITHMPPISRTRALSDAKLRDLIPSGDMIKLFTFSKGAVFIPLKDGIGIFFLKDKKDVDPKQLMKEYQKFNENMQGSLHQDISSLYLEHAKKGYKINFNDDVLKKTHVDEDSE